MGSLGHIVAMFHGLDSFRECQIHARPSLADATTVISMILISKGTKELLRKKVELDKLK